MGKQREEMWEFEDFIYRHKPSDAGYYFLVRYNKNNETVRAPETGTWRAREPFESPIAPSGAWFVFYSKDSAGRDRVPHVGRAGPLRAMLRWPGGETEQAEDAPSEKKDAIDPDLLKALASGIEEDDEEGSLKATRIDAKKREIALRMTAKEQKLTRSAAQNKELFDSYNLNRALRLELIDQSERMSKLHKEAGLGLERQYVLFERMQESAMRQSEREKEAAEKAASPPPPPDYTPVLQSVLSTIRDIGVSAFQRDSNKAKVQSLDSPQPVKAALTETGSMPGALAEALHVTVPTATSATSSIAPGVQPPPSASTARPTYEEILAERDRLRADLAAAQIRKTLPQSSAEPPKVAVTTPPAEPLMAVAATTPAAPPLVAATPPASASPVAAVPQSPVVPPVAVATLPSAGIPPNSSQEQPEPSKSGSDPAPSSPATAVTTPEISPRPPISVAADGATPEVSAADSLVVQELLVNSLAGKLLEDPDAPIPPPLVKQVEQLEKVLVDPPKMDHATATRLLKDGTALEAFGAFLFFNPMIRAALLSRRSK
jgi:hypothetical protein